MVSMIAAVAELAVPLYGVWGPVTAIPSSESLSRLHSLLLQRDEFVLAQVHSHPGIAFHSDLDDYGAATLRSGFVSIVVPDYGCVPLNDLSHCAVFECQGGSRWAELACTEVIRRFRVID